MIFEVMLWKGMESKTKIYSGSSDSFCEELKKLLKDKEWRVSFIDVKKEIMLIDKIEVKE